MKTQLKIGAYTWEYSDEVEPKELKQDFGSCDYQALKIEINNTLHGDVKSCTIYHEILHAMITASGLSIKKEEDVVDALANQLLMFLKENKQFVLDHLLPSD